MLTETHGTVEEEEGRLRTEWPRADYDILWKSYDRPSFINIGRPEYVGIREKW